MRWSGQQVLDDGVGAERALPGLRGLLRSVRTPEFAGAVFHEVEAKSVLNRVSGDSPLPFRWTVNPYRGCSHACVYCLAGPTRVLLADGRTRPISQLQVGDVVMGTELVDGTRRYVRTTVLAHWSTVRPAHRVRLADGTELVASGEHRFLTDAGWRHVTGGWCRAGRRPRLRLGSALLGPGGSGQADVGSPRAGGCAGPARSAGPAYRQGYLCGLVRADADGPCDDAPPSGTATDWEIPRIFPSVALELEALGRAHHFLAELAHDRPAGTGPRGACTPVEPCHAAPATTGAQMHTARARWLPGSGEPGRVPRPRPSAPAEGATDWPDHAGQEWCAGFLAGVVDARGEVVDGELMVGHADEEIVGRFAGALHRFGFRFAIEPDVRPEVARPKVVGRRRVVRLLGGPAALLRLVQVADPAVSQRRDVGGAAVEGSAALRVTSVEELGVDMPMFDITTGTGDFIAEGVISHNCLTRPKGHTSEQVSTPGSASTGPARGPASSGRTRTADA